MIGIPARPTARTNKAPRDTAAGCRIRAAADLLASVSMLTANERIRLETSAASWGARAALLQGIDERAEARKAQLQADVVEADEKRSPLERAAEEGR
jgi:hypothetical protein